MTPDEIREVVREELQQALSGGETVDVRGAAALLKTTVRGIYQRRARGMMPDRVRGSKRLLWRKADLLRVVK